MNLTNPHKRTVWSQLTDALNPVAIFVDKVVLASIGASQFVTAMALLVFFAMVSGSSSAERLALLQTPITVDFIWMFANFYVLILIVVTVFHALLSAKRRFAKPSTIAPELSNK
jgi:hypothetical protein